MADVTRLGQAGLMGWREKVGDTVAEPVAKRTPLSADQTRALVGGIFFVLSLVYVVRTLATAAREVRNA
jgi:hypothetical protein